MEQILGCIEQAARETVRDIIFALQGKHDRLQKSFDELRADRDRLHDRVNVMTAASAIQNNEFRLLMEELDATKQELEKISTNYEALQRLHMQEFGSIAMTRRRRGKKMKR